MNTLTVRLPDDTAERLKRLARSRGMSVGQLIEEICVQALLAYDAENRFRTMAAQADLPQALAILGRLDQAGDAGCL